MWMKPNKLYCNRHNVELEFLPGRPAHASNLYCPICEEEKETGEKMQLLIDDSSKVTEESSD